MSDEEPTCASDEIQRLRKKVRSALADDLGGKPEDYRADSLRQEGSRTGGDETVPDGGD